MSDVFNLIPNSTVASGAAIVPVNPDTGVWGSPPPASHQMPPAISRAQAYYWSRAWQAGEAESLVELQAGHGRVFRDPTDLARYLLGVDDEE